MMKDSRIDQAWLAEQMRVNPPKMLPNGNIFSGPVRLAFANIFKAGKSQNPGQEGKFGAALLFPPNTDMTVFTTAWTQAAREGFPRNWDAQGQPVGLHWPFHDQREKAFGPKPMAGYTPGAYTFNVSSRFAPPVVHISAPKIPVTNEDAIYSGVWAFVAINTYKYGPPQPKSGIGFGLQTVMIIGDDMKLSGGGGNPEADFAGVTITAQSNVAGMFQHLPVAAAPVAASVMPQHGYAGPQGNLPVQGLPLSASDLV